MQWTVGTDVNIRDFGMDLFQDLVVILGKEAQKCAFPSTVMTTVLMPFRRGRSIHLRTMSTGDPHPAAKNPNLSHELKYVQLGGMATIQVSNDHVGVWFWNEVIRPLGLYPAHELVIWNWKTGAVLLVNIIFSHSRTCLTNPSSTWLPIQKMSSVASAFSQTHAY
jgi:hypothetical protein